MRNQERPAGLLTKIAGAVINFFAASDARSRDRNDLDKPSPVAFDTPILPTSRIEVERAAADAPAPAAEPTPAAVPTEEVAAAHEPESLAQPGLAATDAEEAAVTPAASAPQEAPLLLTSELATGEAGEAAEPVRADEESQEEPQTVAGATDGEAEAEEPAIVEEAPAEVAIAPDAPASEVQDAAIEAPAEAAVAAGEDGTTAEVLASEAQGGEFDLQQLVASLATDKRGRAKTPKDFYGVMRFRFGMNRETVKATLELCEHGVAKRGEGKKVLCAWVETLLRNVPGEQLKLSEIRATLPDFIYKTYGPHAAQGLVGAVSSCEFIAVIRDGERVDGRAKAGDTIRIA